jgi:hypothetical protein
MLFLHGATVLTARRCMQQYQSGQHPSRYAPWLYGFLSGGAATALGFTAYNFGSSQHGPLPQQLQHTQGWPSWPAWLRIGSAKGEQVSACLPGQ